MALVGKLFKALKRTRETISDAFDSVRKQKVSIESLDELEEILILADICLLYTSPSPRDQRGSRMPSSA